jgi:hypothetical protein
LTTRFDVERALEVSDLPPVSRHIVLVLCSRMDAGTTVIPPRHSPSLTRLARGTGWDRRTIMRHLARLETKGWLTRIRPSPHQARAQHITTAYAVTPPAAYPHPGAQDPVAEGTPPPGLGAPGDTARGSVPRRSDQPDLIQIVIDGISKRTGKTITPEWARKVLQQILSRPGIEHRAAYVKRIMTTDPDLTRFLPGPDEPRYTKEKGFGQ